MSIQSDIEILSVQVMETYAKCNRLTDEGITDLLHKYQVFEKMVTQHEYLHQA